MLSDGMAGTLSSVVQVTNDGEVDVTGVAGLLLPYAGVW